jgi:creatinine amidohydrolase
MINVGEWNDLRSRMGPDDWSGTAELATRPKSLAIFPVGSLEQHGPHLPVITDTASAHAAAVRAARLVATEVPVAVLPGFWLGMSEHHFPFGGTLSLDFQAYQSIFGCVLRSLKLLGFSRLLVVNGHGGNVDPLAVLVRELAATLCPLSRRPPGISRRGKLWPSLIRTAREGTPVRAKRQSCWPISADTVHKDQFECAMRPHPQGVLARAGFYRFYSFSERAPTLRGSEAIHGLRRRKKGRSFL